MQLSCEDIPRLASDFIGRDLPMGLRLRVGLHLAMCQACRAYMRGLGKVRDLAARSLQGQAPAELLQRLGLGGTASSFPAAGRVRDLSPPKERDIDDAPARTSLPDPPP